MYASVKRDNDVDGEDEKEEEEGDNKLRGRRGGERRKR